MKPLDLDWTFDHIPPDGEGEALPRRPQEPPGWSREPRRPARSTPLQAMGLSFPRRWQRRALVALLVAAALAALGAFVFQRTGWQRLQAQIAHEVQAEDAAARARQARAVVDFQSPNARDWLALRAALAEHGLAAPLPAPNLAPIAAAPELGPLQTVGDGLFEVSVVRAYAGQGGQVYRFRQVQRYRNLRPGLWERLPPEAAALAPGGRWAGQRVDVTYPAADWPWLEGALPRLDAALERACADWACPPDLKVQVEFSGKLEAAWPRAALPADAAHAYPIAFTVQPELPRYPASLVLPSPQLTGVPQDAAASEALLRSTIAQALVQLAEQVSSRNGRPSNFYFDALVARAEIRLGLSPQPSYAPTPETFVPPTGLWRSDVATRDVDLASLLPFRLQALGFLDYALSGQPPTVDGQLLRSLRAQTGLLPWLSAAVEGADDLPARWTERVLAASPAGSPFAWQSLDGLAYACNDGSWLIHDGHLMRLPQDNTAPQAGAQPSPDGRYLAYTGFSAGDGLNYLRVQTLDGRQEQTVALGRYIGLLGWSADGQLLYLQGSSLDPGQRGAQLLRYDPARGVSHLVMMPTVRPRALSSLDGVEAAWSPDRRSLLLTINTSGWRRSRSAAALVSLAGPGSLRVLADDGAAPVMSPDGRLVAYGLNAGQAGRAGLELFDLGSGQRRALLSADGLALDGLINPLTGPSSGGPAPDTLVPLRWSPDGQSLALLASGPGYGTQLFTVDLDGQNLSRQAGVLDEGWVLPMRFSPDGRYLAFFLSTQEGSGAALTLVERETGRDREPGRAAPLSRSAERAGRVQRLPAYSGGAAWSPTGHLLVLATTEGAYLLDPASGQRRWLAFQPCQTAAWYRLAEH